MSLKTKEIKLAIKVMMKRKGYTYGNLATHLEVSHATVKRILTSEELSLRRLLVICDWLELTLSDLEAIASSADFDRVVTYTQEQEEFLSSDPRYFVYLIHLYSGIKPSDIAQQFGLNKRSTEKYLLKLEQNDLIKVTGGGQVRPKHKTQPRWISGGALMQAHYKSAMRVFSKFFVVQADEEAGGQKSSDAPRPLWTSLACRPMGKKNAHAMQKELEELVKRWEKVASLEEKIEGSENVGRMVQMTCLTWKESEDDVNVLERVFGEVENFY